MKVSKRLIAFFIVVAVFIITWFFIPTTNALSISNRKNPSERIYSVNAYDLGFCISYTHSVNKGRVHDYYKFDKKTGELIMTETHFVSYGAGIPEPEETEGAEFEVLDNGYIIHNINRKVQTLLMAVGVIADHTISVCYYGAEKIGEPLSEVPLKNYFAPQTSLIFEHKKISNFEYLTHKYKEDLLFY